MAAHDQFRWQPVINLKHVRILGAYLTVVCALQICLYLAMAISAERYMWLFYFDPRIGLSVVESIIRGAEQPPPGILGWVSAAWVLALGLLLLSGRPLIRTYVISEVALATPNLLFVFAVASANLSPAHGFSVAELFVPVCLMIVFSAVPLGLAFHARSRLTPPQSNI
jgi:hypothetical protein